MYKDSQERARYLYLSLTDQKEVMGVPLDAFKIILGINTLIYFLTKSFLVLLIFGVMMVICSFVSQEDKYNLSIVKRHFFNHSESYDA